MEGLNFHCLLSDNLWKNIGRLQNEFIWSVLGGNFKFNHLLIILLNIGMDIKLVDECILVNHINKDANVSLPLLEASGSIVAEERVKQGSLIDIKLRIQSHVECGWILLECKVKVILQ